MHVRLQSLVAFALIIGLLWPGTVLASTRASVPGVTELFF